MWIAEKEVREIQHALNGLEFRVGKYKVDGKCGNTVYEFNGCKSLSFSLSVHLLLFLLGFWHGCRKCFPDGDLISGGCYKSMNEKLQDTYEKEEELKRAGFDVVTMWECDLKQMLASDQEMKEFFDNCAIPTPLNPRDAFYGGRTGPTTLHRKAEEGERIDHVDICR